MGFRFRKSIKICPGVKLNVSKSGISTTLGGNGLSANISQKGVYGTLGMPGTGISYRTKLPTQNDSQIVNNNRESVTAGYVEVDDFGKVYFYDTNNCLIDSKHYPKLKKMYPAEVEQAIIKKLKEINEITDRILEIHKQEFSNHDWISDSIYRPYVKECFSGSRPDKFAIQSRVEENYPKTNILSSLFKSKEREDAIKSEVEKEYSKQVQEYTNQKLLFEKHEEERRLNYDTIETQRNLLAKKILMGDIDAVEQVLEDVLSTSDFPLNTNVSFCAIDDHTIFLDVDLPPIEDIPLEKATLTPTGRLSLKQKGKKELNELYLNFVIGAAIRLAKITFSVLPNCDCIIISGYTNRFKPSENKETIQYIYSFEINEPSFNKLDFVNSKPMQLIHCFEPIIDIKSNFELKEILPYDITS